MRRSRRQMAIVAVGSSLATVAALSALAQSGEETAVASAVDAFRQAVLSVDRARLEALFAPEASFGHAAGRVDDRQAFIDSLASGPQLRSIDLSDRRVTVSGDTAIARHTFTAEGVNRAGQPVRFSIGQMQVWQKRGRDWVMLALQNHPRPTQN